jgi:alpha-tubulin suppressor-like RCC1 family protein
MATLAAGETTTLVIYAGDLYVTGSNTYHQLGVPADSCFTFTRVDDVDAVDVAAGAHHSAAINSAGDVLVAGTGTHGHHETFRPVALVAGRAATSVALADQAIAVIDDHGRVQVSGTLGTDVLTAAGEFRQLDLSARRVAANKTNLAVIDDNGRLWTAGAATSGQLGRSGSPGFGLVDLDRCVTDVAIGANFLLTVDDDGQVWGCGSNDVGQLGTGHRSRHLTWRQLDVPSAVGVRAGRASASVLTADGVWVSGSRVYGEIPVTTGPVHVTTFTRVDTPPVADMASGGRHSVVRGVDGAVRVCGSNNDGQLGCGNPDNVDTSLGGIRNVTEGLQRVDLGGFRAELASQLRGPAMSIDDAYRLADTALT